MTYRKLESVDSVDFGRLRSAQQGEMLVPAIAIDKVDLAMGKIACVRMVGLMNRAALEATFASGCVTFFSRSSGELWQKGEESGNILNMDSVYIDCDNDSLLITVDAVGPTCHTGAESCFEELNDTI